MAVSNFKILISGGCSFTAGANKWNHFTAENLGLKHNNYAWAAAGNAYISRAVVYGVYKALEDYDPSEILVGVMWSGKSRYDSYHSDVSIYKKKPIYNFVKEDKGAWVRMPHFEQDWYSTPFFKLYFDNIGSCIDTYEHILRVQWLLENHKIAYFMTCYSDDALPNNEEKTHPSLTHLSNMINWSKFLPVNNCFDWCLQSGIKGNAPDEESRLSWLTNTNKLIMGKANHPSPEQQYGFAEQVVVPFIKENILK